MSISTGGFPIDAASSFCIAHYSLNIQFSSQGKHHFFRHIMRGSQIHTLNTPLANDFFLTIHSGVRYEIRLTGSTCVSADKGQWLFVNWNASASPPTISLGEALHYALSLYSPIYSCFNNDPHPSLAKESFNNAPPCRRFQENSKYSWHR